MSVTTHEADTSPRAITAIEDALRAFAKALRAVQLYLPNNPTRAQSIEQARQAFARLWPVVAPVELQVGEASFKVEGQVVYQDMDRGTESLPWLLFRDGIRALTFQPGFEEADLPVLLGLLQQARAATTDDDDLVTMLWVADLAHVTYRFIESTNAGDAVPAPVDRAGVATQAPGEAPLAVPFEEADGVGEGPAGILRMDDFDSTLYFLEPREASYLKDELEREYAEDHRLPVLASLFEMLALQPWSERQLEALQILYQLVLDFLTLGEYDLVAFILREADDLARSTALDERIVSGLRDLPSRLSEPPVITQLLQALDESARTPATSILEALFSEMRAPALEPLVSWLGGAPPSPVRVLVERASLRLAASTTGELAKLLEHPQVGVVRGALRIASQLATPAVVPGLARILRLADAKLRAEAVTALSDIGSPSALQAVERAIDDADREVRVAVYRAIAARKHSAALPRLLDVLRRKETRAADLGEKMALFETFGGLCGDAGVAELDGILNARGLLGAREAPEMRACAARALGLVATRGAVAALQKAADTKDVVVRSAVARAMRGGS